MARRSTTRSSARDVRLPAPVAARRARGAAATQATGSRTRSTRRTGRTSLPLRAVPSGGALYPLELYVAALRVDGLEPGLYHFDPLRRGLEIMRIGTRPRRRWRHSRRTRRSSAGCAALLLVAAVFGRTRFKYGLRGYRFALLEAGHVGQNVLLAATALGLAAVPLGGFYDRRADEFLGLDGVNESTLYTVAVGRARVTNDVLRGRLLCRRRRSRPRSPSRRPRFVRRSEPGVAAHRPGVGAGLFLGLAGDARPPASAPHDCARSVARRRPRLRGARLARRRARCARSVDWRAGRRWS